MKIALVEPRPPFNTNFFFKRLPLLGSLFLGAMLKEAGHEVRVFKEDFAPVLREKYGWLHPFLASADAVGVTAITHTANRAYRIADAVRERSPGTRIIIGEGEAVVREVFEGRRSERIVAGPRVDIDAVPMVDLSLLEGVRSRRGRPGLPIAPIMASRGCPHDCVFCSVTKMFGRHYRVRNPDLVLEEVLLLTDSNYYSLPLGRMGRAEAPPGQGRGLRFRDGLGEKRTVAETVGREGHHEELGNFGRRTRTVAPWVGRGETDHPGGAGAHGVSSGKRDPDRGVECLS